MLLGLSAADARVMSRGIVIFTVAVIVGVVAADNQVNCLTARNDFGQALNIRRETDGFYRAYVFGQNWGLKTVYPVGAITSGDDALTVTVSGQRLTVPTAARFNLERTIYWLDVWRRQFVAAAWRTRQELAGYREQLQPFIHYIIGVLKR
jgi:hypothetical protein